MNFFFFFTNKLDMEPTTTFCLCVCVLFYYFFFSMNEKWVSEHKVIFRALSIAGIEYETSISQTLRNEPMTTRPTTPVVTTTHFFHKGNKYNI